jgi:hypothetical protein
MKFTGILAAIFVMMNLSLSLGKPQPVSAFP